MLQKLSISIEWMIGILSLGGAMTSLLFVMFTSSPNFGLMFTPLQKMIFNTQGLWVALIVGGIIISFILQFFVKSVPWNHIVGVIGLLGLFCLLIFFSAYF